MNSLLFIGGNGKRSSMFLFSSFEIKIITRRRNTAACRHTCLSSACRPPITFYKSIEMKITIAAFLLNLVCVTSLAQLPLVYDKENTGSKYKAPAMPILDKLPVIDPLPDPFAWANRKGRSTKFSDWEKRRNEIKAEIEHYEIGRKPGRPDTITASYSKADSILTVIVTVNGKTLTLSSKIILPAGNGPFPAGNRYE